MINKRAITVSIVLVFVALVLLIVWQFGMEPATVDKDQAIDSVADTPKIEKDFKDGAVVPVAPLEEQATRVIDIVPIAFSPDKATIKKGDSVIWTNRDDKTHWLEPIGVEYPERGECGSKLNSCRAMKLGESWKVTFNVVGEWHYQDKLNPKLTGVVKVQ